MGDVPGPSTAPYFNPRKARENFSRLCLVMTICSDLFRDILSRYIRPANLRLELNNNRTKLEKIMNAQQKEQIYPSSGATTLTAKDLDLSVIYILLRNICNIPKHRNGWGNPPLDTDTSLAACIERIRIQRNLISGHSTIGEIEDAAFQDHWDELKNNILEIESQLIGGDMYERGVDELLSCDLNPTRSEKYVREFKNIRGELLIKRENMENLESAQKTTKRHLAVKRARLDDVEERPSTTTSQIRDLQTSVWRTMNEKENILRDCHAWLKDNYKNIRVMRLYIGKPDLRYYKYSARQEVIVLVVDGFNPIKENTYQHRKNTFPIICKLWKFLPKDDVSTRADVEPLSCSTILSKVEKEIQSISKGLFQRHSNLEIVSASEYRLKDIGEKESEICIVLYCSCKGIVPLHETEFPTEIAGIKTDVREGFFHLFGNGNLFKRSTDLLNPLMMGASIGKKDDNNGGTLGGFVTLNNGDIGFITCAHVLFDLSSQCDPSEHFDVVQPSYGYMNTNEVCGTHERSCFPSPSNTSNCTIDAALVKLTDRVPERGLFAELTVDNLKENGYSIENLPEYSTGDIRDCEEAGRRMLPCVKWGAKTGFTRGMLRLEGTAVRWTTDSINLGNPPSQVSYIYNKQLEIQGIGGVSFALPGDSGALVFQIDPGKEKGEEHQLYCIGMIVGGTSAGKTIVTPIKPILEALGVNMHKFPLNTMDES